MALEKCGYIRLSNVKDERIAEYGLIALDEIDAMGAKELNVMKSVITASDISERAAYGYTKERPMPLDRLGMLLQKAGYKGKRMNYGKARGWIVYERSAEEVNANRNIEGAG